MAMSSKCKRFSCPVFHPMSLSLLVNGWWWHIVAWFVDPFKRQTRQHIEPCHYLFLRDVLPPFYGALLLCATTVARKDREPKCVGPEVALSRDTCKTIGSTFNCLNSEFRRAEFENCLHGGNPPVDSLPTIASQFRWELSSSLCCSLIFRQRINRARTLALAMACLALAAAGTKRQSVPKKW